MGRSTVALVAALAMAAVWAPSLFGRAAHPLGDVPRDVARTGPGAIAADVDYVDCLDCHAAHGSQGRILLNPACTTTTGCTRCHIGVAPDRGPRTHPVDLAVSDRAVLAELLETDVVLGPGNTVVCLTCHAAHTSDADMSAQVSQDRCIICHRQQVALRGGAHDLRPGAESHVSSACMACHTIHDASGPALGLTGGDLLDPTGCLTCHSADGDASTVIDPDANHPLYEPNRAPDVLPSVGRGGTMALGEPGDMGCLTCHDTHAPAAAGNPLMLRLSGGDAAGCTICHPEQPTVVGTDHDFRRVADTFGVELAERLDHAGTCVGCHDVHGTQSLWDFGDPEGSPAIWACLRCHRVGNALGATEVSHWEHPDDLLLTTYELPWVNFGELPLYDSQGRPTDDNQLGQIACLTCHEAHVWSRKHGTGAGAAEGDSQSSFLRDDWEPFCSSCHGEEALPSYRYFHDADFRSKMEQRRERRDWPKYE